MPSDLNLNSMTYSLKKFLLFLVVSICTFTTAAKQLDEGHALKRALASFSTQNPRRVPPRTSSMKRIHTSANPADRTEVYLYVYSLGDDNGFMIVSADDCAAPVLGYSDRGNADMSDAPDGLKYWLTEYGRQIQWLRDHPDQATPYKIRRASYPDIEPLVSAAWTQRAPFNKLCPLWYDGRATLIGCGATAAAQIMKSFNHPSHGSGSVTYETWDQTLSVSFEGVEYDWDKMLDIYREGAYTDTEAEAVAMLCFHVAAASQTMFGPGASSSGTNDIRKALIGNFGYDKAMKYTDRDLYTPDDFENLLIEELSNGRPIFYTGVSDKSVGHAFVLDGINSSGMVHMNWGWGSGWAGYYELSALNPTPAPGYFGETQDGYNHFHQVLTGIQPDKGNPYPIVEIFSRSDFTLSESPIDGANQFIFPAKNDIWADIRKGIWNMSAEDGDFTFALKFVETTGSREHIIESSHPELSTFHIPSETKIESFPNHYQPGNIPDGNYKVYPVYSTTSGSGWKTLKTHINNRQHIYATIASGKVTYYNNGFDDTPITPIVKPETIVVSHSEISLFAGQAAHITATVYPENAADKSIAWTSSDETVVSVDNTGIITAIAVGTATIHATCGETSATCRVTVMPTPAERVVLDRNEIELKAHGGTRLTATVLPASTTDKTITWTSSDETIAKVDNTGMITAIAVGAATVYATCGHVEAACQVTVVPTPAQSILLNRSHVDLRVDESEQLKAIIMPDNATDKTITWTSSDETVAKVDETGLVIAVGLGEATINAYCWDASETCRITVWETPVQNIELDKNIIRLKAEETEQLTATVYPENATYKHVTWVSDNKAVATVDETGLVTAVELGSTYIWAECGETHRRACMVIVESTPAEQIELDRTDIQLKVEETTQLIATILPATTTDKRINWFSSDETVVTVDNTGVVKAVNVGSASIKAQDGFGIISATCQVTVLPTAAETITLEHSEIQLQAGQIANVMATVYPETTTDKTITWTSSDEAVATVDAYGNITAVAVGDATIHARCGDASAGCHVTVVPTFAEYIIIEPIFLELRDGDSDRLSATVYPENTTDKTVTWTSSDENIVKVDAYGTVTAVAVGSATVHGACGRANGVCYISVEPVLAEHIWFDEGIIKMEEGQSRQLTVNIEPENTTCKQLLWSTSSETIASVTQEGVVTMHQNGTVRVFACTTDGSALEASCEVVGVSGIELVLKDINGKFEVYDTSGLLIMSADANDLKCLQNLQKGHYYIIKTAKGIYKVRL